MKRHPIIAAALLVGMSVSSLAAAQSRNATCPTMKSADLEWQQNPNPDLLVCNAVRADGSLAFMLIIDDDYPFKPNRRDRAETSEIAGASTSWYKAEIAGNAGVTSRETQVKLASGLQAYFSVQTNDPAQLPQVYQAISQIDFSGR